MHQIFTKSTIKQSIFLALLVAMMFSSASAVFADNVNNTLSNSQTIQDPSGVGSSPSVCERVSVYWFRNNGTSYNAYRSTINDLATAQKIMSNVSYTDPTYGGFIDTVQPGLYFYWIENVGGSNIVPSFNNSTGVMVFPCAVSLKPSITLKGDALMVLKLNDTFTDPGATASDQKDGDLSSFVSVSGYVDTHISGSYTVTYTVTNSANLTTYAKRRVVIGPANMCFIDICAGGGKGQPVLVPPASYPDVSSDTQYYFDIRQATSRCLMIGYGDGLFGPTDNLTRDQISYVLSRMLHVDITDIPATQTFTDVPFGSYGRPYIEAINKKGFIESCSSTDSSIFCPTKATTRQHLAVALA